MSTENKYVSCPTCGKKNIWNKDNPFRPFCSDRCKLIDLGDWAAGKHRVAGEPVNINPDDEKEDES